MQIRIMTFNIENLFPRPAPGRGPEIAGRFDLSTDRPSPREEMLAEAAALMLEDEERGLAAQAIRAGKPDVVLLQEVAGDAALTLFHDRYLVPLGGAEMPYRAVPPGNDPRGICVGVMSRLPLDALSSHRHLTLGTLFQAGFRFEDYGVRHRSVTHDKLFSDPETPVFCRDCLEVRLEVEGRPLLVFAAHFKAPTPSRGHTFLARLAEAAGVAHLIQSRGRARGIERWVVAGDLNDFYQLDGEPAEGHGLAPLLDSGLVSDPMARVARATDRWTHFDPTAGSYRQLDYLLLSPALAAANEEVVPTAVRAGQPWRAERVGEARFPRVGWDRPKASDHCPLVIELEI